MDEYIVIDLIGEGNFGKVYRCKKKSNSQLYAVKLINKKSRNEKEIRSLRQEISIFRTLSHPNIVQCIDNFESMTEFGIVMELAHGELYEIIGEHIDHKRFSDPVIQSIANQLIGALYYLHSNQIMHRDIKPQNILIGVNGMIKICDFGFAKVISNDEMNLTATLKGTPLYLAPEIVQQKSYDHRADLWSLGVIIYELATGRQLFQNDSLVKLIQMIIDAPIRIPPADCTFSPNLTSIIKGLLTKDPNQRLNWPDLLNHPFISSFDNSTLLFQSPNLLNHQSQEQNSHARSPLQLGVNNSSNNTPPAILTSPLISHSKPPIIMSRAANISIGMNGSKLSTPPQSPSIRPHSPGLGSNTTSSYTSIAPPFNLYNTPIKKNPSYLNKKPTPLLTSISTQIRPSTPLYNDQLNNNSNGIMSSKPSLSRPQTPLSRPQTPTIFKVNFNITPVITTTTSNRNGNIHFYFTPSVNTPEMNPQLNLNELGNHMESVEYWNYHEQSSQNESFAMKITKDKLFIQKLITQLSIACTPHIDIIPISTILKIFSNILRNGQFRMTLLSGPASGTRPVTSSRPIQSPPTPTTPPTNNPFQPKSPSSGVLGVSTSSTTAVATTQSQQQQQQQQQPPQSTEPHPLISQKSTILILFINLLSNVLSTSIPTHNIGNLLAFNSHTNLMECINAFSIYLEKLQPSFSVLMTSSTSQSPPRRSSFSGGSGRGNSSGGRGNSSGSSSSSSSSSMLTDNNNLVLLLSILNYLTKNIYIYNNNLQQSIIRLMTQFFSRLGDSAPIADMYSKILDNTDIIQNLASHLFLMIKDNSPVGFEEAIKCLNSFIITSPNLVFDFPLDPNSKLLFQHQPARRPQTGAAHQTHSTSLSQEVDYQNVVTVLSDLLAIDIILDKFINYLVEGGDAQCKLQILQILLHCSRSPSKSVLEAIHRYEMNLMKGGGGEAEGPLKRHSILANLFGDLARGQPQINLQEVLMLFLGSSLLHYPESRQWILKINNILDTIKKHFCSMDLRVSSCASYFLAHVLTEYIYLEKDFLDSQNEEENQKKEEEEEAENNLPHPYKMEKNSTSPTVNNGEIDENLPEISKEINTIINSIPIKNIRKLFGSKRVEGHTMRELEGGCFGKPYIGMLDGSACLVFRLLKRGGNEFFFSLLESGIWEAICHQISDSTTDIELSPPGVSFALRSIYEVISKPDGYDNFNYISYLVKNNLLLSLCKILQSDHIERLSCWPEIMFGGESGVGSLVFNVVYIIFLPLLSTKVDTTLTELIQVIMLSNDLISNLVHVVPRLQSQTLDLTIGLLSTIILECPGFVNQYVDSGGLEPNILEFLLSPKQSSLVLVDTLIILSQIARISEENYASIHRAEIYSSLITLLQHPDPSVRAKTCNLIGNMFKFNSFFYQYIKSYGDILPLLIGCCTDLDSTTRKFACFAIGNAASHSDELYEDLQDAIIPLLTCLEDGNENEKTKSNVIGAIGNLARNSNTLCQSIVESGGIDILLSYLDSIISHIIEKLEDKQLGDDDDNQVIAFDEEKSNLLKSTLFSLGTFCNYDECKPIILQHPQLFEKLELLSSINDSVLLKYINRIHKSLNL